MENKRTENICCLDLKHIHKYGCAKFQPNPLFSSQQTATESAAEEKKQTKKKVGKPIGDPVGGRDAPMTLDCGKEFTFREPEPDQLGHELMAQDSANINMMVLPIKDRFGISDMAMHYPHTLKQPIPAKSQLVKERAKLNTTLPI